MWYGDTRSYRQTTDCIVITVWPVCWHILITDNWLLRYDPYPTYCTGHDQCLQCRIIGNWQQTSKQTETTYTWFMIVSNHSESHQDLCMTETFCWMLCFPLWHIDPMLFVLDYHMKYKVEVVPLHMYIVWFVILW